MEDDTKLASMLDEEEGAAPAAFKDYFFKYRELKEYLKYRHLNSTSEPADPEQALKSEKDFLRLVCVQLKRVDKCFERESRKVLTAFELESSSCGCGTWLKAILCCVPGALGNQTPEDLAYHAKWCLKYAQLNHQALREIAQERDRYFGGRLGEEFVQACFRGEVAVYSFMSPSALSELAAVEQIMQERVQQRPPWETAPAPTSSRRAEEAGSTTTEALVDGVSNDHICAICLDLLYQPVALSCGHVFCSRCAVAAATGTDNTVGSAQALLETSACYHSQRPCPCCRLAHFGNRHEKRSPYWNIKRLTRLEAVLKERYPEDWQRRKAEDSEHQAALKAQKPASWRTWRHLMPDAVPI